MVETRMSSVGAVGLEIDATVLRQAPLGDVEPRHDLEARDDGVLETAQIFRHGHGHEQAVHPVTDAQLSLLRLEMDVGRLVGDGLRDDVAHEAHDGGVLVHDLLLGLDGLRGDVGVVAVFERAGADAEGFDDELVHALGHGEMPHEGARREGAHPVQDRVVGRPGGGQVQGQQGAGRRGWAPESSWFDSSGEPNLIGMT
jgi:hypothetical protein